MAIIDHFKPLDDPGFRRSVDPETARQQLKMSLGLVVVLAVAAAAMALTVRFEPKTLQAQMRAPVKLVVQLPQRAPIQQADATKQLPGG